MYCGVRTYTLTVNALPTPTVAIVNDSVVATSGADHYQWFLNGENINGANDNTYIPTEAGLFSVDATMNGCTGHSNEVMFTITGIENVEKAATVFPNPTIGKINLSGIDFNNSRLSWHDVTGKTMSAPPAVVSNKMMTFDLRGMPNGVYLLKIENAQMTVVRKIVLLE